MSGTILPSFNYFSKKRHWTETDISEFQAKSQFKRRSTANNVEIIIPVPPDADSPKFKTTIGAVKYVPEENAVIWSIKQFPVSFFNLKCFLIGNVS